MNSMRKLKRYELAIREWVKKRGKWDYAEPLPEHHGLKRVEEIFCAKKIRAKVIEEADLVVPPSA